MKKRRLLSIVLSLCMVMALMPQMVFAETSGATADGFSYTISDANEVTITGYTGSSSAVVIPGTINDNPVTAIGNATFREKNIESVTIPSSVTSIGYEAFYNCTSLTNLTFENNSQLTSIGIIAFYKCTSLTSVTIPSRVTSIGDGSFDYCTSLTSIMVDENNTAYSSVDGVLFKNGGEELIKYPAGKTSTSYSIPGGVKSINYQAFYGCTNLERITIPDSVTSIGESAFDSCTSLTSITIPDSVTSISKFAFHGCTNLERITIPNSVTKIEWGAFQYCSGLTDVYYLGTKEQWNQIRIAKYNSDLTGDNNAKVRCIGDITQGFSFTQPGNLTYDGKAKEATVTKTNEDYGDVTIKYYDQNDQVYTTGPVDAGTYTVKRAEKFALPARQSGLFHKTTH